MRTSARTMPLLTFCLAILPAGCSIHHFDDKTGTEHIWGIGHMTMRVSEPNEGVRAVVGQVQTVGLSAGSVQETGFATIGWQRLTRLLAIDADTTIRFEWPDSDLLDVRVGTRPSWERVVMPAPAQLDKEERP